MFVVGAAAGGCGGQEMLWEDDLCAQAWAVGVVAAFSNAIEAVARGDDPSIGGGALQILPEIFEDGRVFGGKGSKVVDGLIDASCQAGGGYVVAEDSAIHNLSEKGRLRNEFAHEVGNVFLTLGSESFLIARAAAEGDHYYFSFADGDAWASKKAGRQQRTAQRDSGRTANELATIPG